ncbi:MAG: GlsB/YeaQ/YmgE family stress response membrane protein [Ignavibacteria bacterium]|nr:GlsB/YeaQ/YmgE family stress response membrane protein [Ignavibacteria bacterium]
MSIIWTIIIGLIAGALAKFIMPGKDPGGIIITILIGIAGSVIFYFLGKFIGIYEQGETAGFIGATIGAIILLAIYRIFKKKSAA